MESLIVSFFLFFFSERTNYLKQSRDQLKSYDYNLNDNLGLGGQEGHEAGWFRETGKEPLIPSGWAGSGPTNDAFSRLSGPNTGHTEEMEWLKQWCQLDLYKIKSGLGKEQVLLGNRVKKGWERNACPLRHPLPSCGWSDAIPASFNMDRMMAGHGSQWTELREVRDEWSEPQDVGDTSPERADLWHSN